HAHGLGVSQPEVRKLLVDLDAYERQVGARIGADHLRHVVVAIAGQVDLDLGGVLDDVVVGQDGAVVADQETGAAALLEARLLGLLLLEAAPLGAARAEEELERVAVERLSLAALLRLEDRKSTRLNSSHDQISYAVFCLKKK